MQRIILMVFFMVLCAPMAAQAAMVSNLTDKPKTLLIQRYGGWDSVTLEAGRSWRTLGRVTILFNAHEIVIEEDKEYAIWSDDVIGPQRTLRTERKF